MEQSTKRMGVDSLETSMYQSFHEPFFSLKGR